MRKKHRSTLADIPALVGGTHRTDVEDLLRNAFNAEVYRGSGSAVTFAVKDVTLTVDRTHPRRECGNGLVKRAGTFLEQIGSTGEAG